ncbi:MAG: hypothetical protein L0Y44_01270 [Phycisphaerales bacterium]|nr:hypothetical protein [Phycisphaerales bacterium]MCI0675351.1 hypothetical protein [Phycisphaerales bacterium]
MKRVGRTIKWMGTVITPLLLALWIASGWWWAVCSITPQATLFVIGGQFHIYWTEPRSIRDRAFETGDVAGDTPEFNWWFDSYVTRFTMGPGGVRTQREVDIPIWFIVLLIGGTTAWMWWREHQRTRPGKCPNCQYPIGTSAVCSECGHRL